VTRELRYFRSIRAMQIRPYQAADLDAVTDLYRRAYRGDIARRRQAFEWIQHHNPCTDEDAEYLLMWEGPQVVGYWGRMPVRLYVRGNPVAAAYSQEALVDLSQRGRGIAKALREVVDRTPRPLMSLWHNEPIVAILSAADWTEVGPLRTLKKLYRIDRLAASRFKNPLLRGMAALLRFAPMPRTQRAPSPPGSYDVDHVRTCGPEFDHLFQRAVTQQAVITERSAAILNWKYCAIPHQTYRVLVARRAGVLLAYCVVRVQVHEDGVRRGLVVDVLCDLAEPEALDALAVHCDRYFRDQDADLAVAECSPLRLRQAFHQLGFRTARPTKTSALWVRNQELVPKGAQLLHDIHEWYLTYGDSDSDMW